MLGNRAKSDEKGEEMHENCLKIDENASFSALLKPFRPWPQEAPELAGAEPRTHMAQEAPRSLWRSPHAAGARHATQHRNGLRPAVFRLFWAYGDSFASCFHRFLSRSSLFFTLVFIESYAFFVVFIDSH